MKKIEKILLLLLLAFFVGRIIGVPGAQALFTIAALGLALAYLVWGYHLLRTSNATPLWFVIAAGIALSASMVALPFAMFVRQELVFKILPLPNGVLLVLLLIRSVRARSSGVNTSGERLLRIRSMVLVVVVGFLIYMPPNAAFRSTIIALNRGNERLIANQHMMEAFEAYETAFDAGDCDAALAHAQRSNREGRIWLFGFAADDHEPNGAVSSMHLSDEMKADLQAIMHQLAKEQQEELWKISRTYDNMYEAHSCVGVQAENVGDHALAYHHFRAADSVLNVIKGRVGDWNEERAWSLRKVARAASALEEYDLSDSLFNTSLKIYKDAKDSLDASSAWILADWSRSMAKRSQWSYSNKLLWMAIGLCERDTTHAATDEDRVTHRLELTKNLMATDSLDLAEWVLQPCMKHTPTDSLLACRISLLMGALQFRQNAFRSADSSFTEALACLSRLRNVEPWMQMTYLSLGHTKTALADYAQALEMVKAGEGIGPKEDSNPAIVGGLWQLRALIHHIQGQYALAQSDYEESLQLLSGTSDRTPGAMAGLADVLLDLAQTGKAKDLAEEALKLVSDSLPAILPSQSGILNTAAYAVYYLHDLDLAHERYALVLDVCQRYEATNTTNYAQALNGQALVEMARSRTAVADTLFALAYRTAVSIHGTDHPFTARVMINQAELRIQQRLPIEAGQFLAAAMPITQRFLGSDHDQLGDIFRYLGDIASRRADPAQAVLHYREALRIYRVCFPADHPKVHAMAARVQ